MSTTKKTVVPSATQKHNILDLATQASNKATSLEAIEIGQEIVGTVVNLQQLKPINGEPVCRLYVHCPEFNVRFNALHDGKVLELLGLKHTEITLVFRGINNVNGQSYPKFSVLN